LQVELLAALVQAAVAEQVACVRPLQAQAEADRLKQH
jgi:hypothetical protein